MQNGYSKQPLLGWYSPSEKQSMHPLPAYGPENNAAGWCSPEMTYEVLEERRIFEPQDEPGRRYSTLWIFVRPVQSLSSEPLWVVMEDLTGLNTGLYLRVAETPAVET